MTNTKWFDSKSMCDTKLSQLTTISNKGFLREDKLDSFMYEIYSNAYTKEVYTEGSLKVRIDEADLWLSEETAEALGEVCKKYLKARKDSSKMAEAIIAVKEAAKDE